MSVERQPYSLLDRMQIGLSDIVAAETLFDDVMGTHTQLLAEDPVTDIARELFFESADQGFEVGEFDPLAWLKKQMTAEGADLKQLALTGFVGKVAAARDAVIEKIKQEWHEFPDVDAWTDTLVHLTSEQEERDGRLWWPNPAGIQFDFTRGAFGNDKVTRGSQILAPIQALSLNKRGTIYLGPGYYQHKDSREYAPHAFHGAVVTEVFNVKKPLTPEGKDFEIERALAINTHVDLSRLAAVPR